MHPYSEKLKKTLENVKKNKGKGIDVFFHDIWGSGVFIPSSEFLALSEELFKWIEPLEIQMPKNYALALFTISIGEYHDGKYDHSLKHAAEAQQLFADMKDEYGIQMCKSILASDYRTLGELELAVKYALESYQYFCKSGTTPIFKGFSQYNLAEMYSETGRLDDSLHFYQESLHDLENADNPHIIARLLLGIGVVYQRQKKYALALQYFNEALQICETQNSNAVKARVLTDMGMYYLEMGDFNSAVKYQQEALDIRERLKIPNAPITNYIHLGEIYRRQGKLDEAIAILSKGLIVAEEIQVKPKIYQIHQLLSEIYEAKGEMDQSLFHHKAFHKIRDEVQHEDNEKKIKNMHLIFEAEQTQKENVIIKAQKKEIEKKNIELQHTIDELTRTRVSRKAKTITLIIAVILFVIEDLLLKTTEGFYSNNGYFIALCARGVIILSLKPIEKIVETYLLKRIMKEKLVMVANE